MRPLPEVTEQAPDPTVVESERSTRAAEIDGQVRDLLARLDAQEDAAEEAQPRPGDFFGWPAWSMDTGLTAAQEKFVEHWSPQRVLDDSRSVRQLVHALRPRRSPHDQDADLDEMLSTFATSQAR